MDNFTPSSNERKLLTSIGRHFLILKSTSCHSLECKRLSFPSGNLISHIFRENEVCRDTEWERYFCYKNIEVPEIYSGPHLTFPLTVEQAVGLVEAFRNKKVCACRSFSVWHLKGLLLQSYMSNSMLFCPCNRF